MRILIIIGLAMIVSVLSLVGMIINGILFIEKMFGKGGAVFDLITQFNHSFDWLVLLLLGFFLFLIPYKDDPRLKDLINRWHPLKESTAIIIILYAVFSLLPC